RVSLYAPLPWNEPIIGSGENGEAAEAVSVRQRGQTELWQPIEVLLVDDHEMMRKGLKKLIEDQNDLKIIAEASDGEEAIKLPKQRSPDVIVMHVKLAGIDGSEATQKSTSDGRNICIIGLSLYDREEVARDMKNAGPSAYLPKPDAFQSSCTTIRNSIRN